MIPARYAIRSAAAEAPAFPAEAVAAARTPGRSAAHQNAVNLALIWQAGWTARRFAAVRSAR